MFFKWNHTLDFHLVCRSRQTIPVVVLNMLLRRISCRAKLIRMVGYNNHPGLGLTGAYTFMVINAFAISRK